mmetsp:Transcript_33697/g.95339  ORF Transcript_33697/g.95339 Transcript_33697/m.95339 type:complete len:218 (-) Transcript_33697:740-1393(-)
MNVILRGIFFGSAGVRSALTLGVGLRLCRAYIASRKARAWSVLAKVRVPPSEIWSLAMMALWKQIHRSVCAPSNRFVSWFSRMIGGKELPGPTPRVVAISPRTHSIRCCALRCSSTMWSGVRLKGRPKWLVLFRRMLYNGAISSGQCPMAVGWPRKGKSSTTLSPGTTTQSTVLSHAFGEMTWRLSMMTCLVSAKEPPGMGPSTSTYHFPLWYHRFW